MADDSWSFSEDKPAPGRARKPRRAARRRLWDSADIEVARFVPARDGTQLFVESWHEPDATGAPLVLCDGLGCDGYIWRYVVGGFRRTHPILHPHYRGHGRSVVPADLDTLRVSTLVDDLERTLDAAGLERGVFLGHSMGIQVLLEAHRRLADRMQGLVLLCGSYEHPLRTWHLSNERDAAPTIENRVMRRAFPHLARMFLEHPGFAQRVWSTFVPLKLSYKIGVRMELNPARVLSRDFMPYLRSLAALDMRVFARLAQDLVEHSGRAILDDIRAPTLIVGGGRDTFTPLWLSEDMQGLIRKSELLPIVDGTHVTPIEHPDVIELRLERFFAEHGF